MLVGEFLNRIQQGETVTGISEALGLHRKTLQRRLRRLGYKWDSDNLRWRWDGKEGSEPLHMSLVDMNMSWSKQLDKSDSQPMNQDKKNIISSPFTLDEIRDLKDMLEQWRQSPDSLSVSEQDLVDRIQQIRNSENEKVRKTIVIDHEIGDRFDDYADKTRLNKSDLLHLAIYELMEKYRLP
ncbi:hypothetical protein BEP19_13095 [Ammoniphilus oxalaticus]|uniref:Uncharacterized protein n=1 Tax=Ammoniphilus oxalaticus TaxID=66863 RepID=A0A419SH90_9BACL|nr:hypothetical protein BEP19_13095 [Ammoniphilus oxalaticus]